MSVLLSSNHDGTAGSLVNASYYSNSNVVEGGLGQAQISTGYRHNGSGQSHRYDGTDGYRTFRYDSPAAAVWNKIAFRGYYKFESAPAAQSLFWKADNITTGNVVCSLGIDTAGKLILKEGNTLKWTSTASIVGVESRIEVRYNVAANTCIARLYQGANLEAAVASYTEDSGGFPLVLEPTGANRIVFAGWVTTTPSRYWLDDIALQDNQSSFIGPLGGAAPSASFTMAPTGGTVPLAVTFTDTSTGAPTSWAWDFGDTGTATTQNPSHTYTTAGTYTVSLTATNGSGSTTTTKSITVDPVLTGLVPVWVRKAGVLVAATGTHLQVRKAGTLRTITTINGTHGVVDPPPPPPPPTERFAGDPGVGKCYIGSNRVGDTAGVNTEDERWNWVKNRLSERTTPLNGPKNRPPHVIRSYLGVPAGDPPSGGTYAWDYPARPAQQKFPSQRLIQYAHDHGAIPWVEIDLWGVPIDTGYAAESWMFGLADAYDAGFTGMTGDGLAAYNRWKDDVLPKFAPFAPNPIWVAIGHEPEDNIHWDSKLKEPQRLTAFRKAQRALVLIARREGYTHLTFPAIAYMTYTLRGQGGRDWRYWYPDWKGTSTNGATASSPFPGGSLADFYTATTRDGSIHESVVDIFAWDQYFWDSEWKADKTIANADLWPSKAASLGWLADHNAAYRFAKVLGKPGAIGELGTQACGYIDGTGKLVQRPVDVANMTKLGTDLGPKIEAGELVAIAYFNTGEHTWGRIDNNYSKCQGLAELYDSYSVKPPVTYP